MRFIYSVKKSSSINIVEMDLLRKDRVLFGKINCLLSTDKGSRRDSGSQGLYISGAVATHRRTNDRCDRFGRRKTFRLANLASVLLAGRRANYWRIRML